MATSVELRQQKAALWTRAREMNDAAEAENRGFTAEEQANWNQINADIDALTGRIERQEQIERTAATDARSPAPIEGPERAAQPGDTAERAAQRQEAFRSYLRYGYSGVPEEQRAALAELRATALDATEQRALGINVNTGAGYLCPPEAQRELMVAMLAYGGMREVSTVISTSNGNDLPWPTMNDTSNTGELVGEHQTVSEQDVAIGQRVMRAYKYSSKEVKVSIELLQDSAYDLDGLLRNVFAERIGRITNTHFTTGAGMDRPSGITIDTVVGQTAAATGAVTADELIRHTYTIDRAYRARGRWMFHSLTARDLRSLVDGDGHYLWGMGLQSGEPDTLLNYPVTINDDMPQMATGNRALLFGDLAKYHIRDVMGIRLLRLEERYAEQGQVAFFAFSRHDGMLMDAGTNPVKHLLMA